MSYGSDASASSAVVENFCTQHNVSQHKRFPTAERSLEYFDWRNDQYFNYEGDTYTPDWDCGPLPTARTWTIRHASIGPAPGQRSNTGC